MVITDAEDTEDALGASKPKLSCRAGGWTDNLGEWDGNETLNVGSIDSTGAREETRETPISKSNPVDLTGCCREADIEDNIELERDRGFGCEVGSDWNGVYSSHNMEVHNRRYIKKEI